MTHHHHAPTLHRARASFYTDGRLASGRRFRLYGRDVALPGRHLSARIEVWHYGGGRWHDDGAFPVGDVCGTPGRVDFAAGTFKSVFGRKAIRRGLVPVRWQFVGAQSARHGGRAKRRRR